METGKVTGVSRTAIGVAWLRAQERLHEDPLFDDPYAADFVIGARDVTESRADDPRRATGAMFGKHVIIRTKFYDDYLLAACAAGIRQVVLVAAGLDTRAFRLDWPDGVRLFELDLPDLLDYKERVLAARNAVPRCGRTVLRVDLRADWAARAVEAGLRPDEPTAWLVEGLLVYLSAEEATTLLTTIGTLSAPGSQLASEHRDGASDAWLERVRATPGIDSVLSMWKGGLSRDTVPWLRRNGWRVGTHDGLELARSYGRGDVEAPPGFLTAVRAGAGETTS